MVNRRSWFGHNKAVRFLGVVAVVSTLAVSGATIASAAPSEPTAVPSASEEASDPSLVTPTSSSTPATTTEEQSDSPGDVQARGVGISQWQNKGTGRCLDDSSLGLRTFPCNGLVFQQWRTRQFDFVYIEFYNNNTGRCLDDSDFGLRTVSCNGGGWQYWVVRNTSSGIEIQNRYTLRCLDDSGAGLRTYSCNGGIWQRWNQ